MRTRSQHRRPADGPPACTGAAAGGQPAQGLAWLAGSLAATGRTLAAGALVITGGLTAAVPVCPGRRCDNTRSREMIS